MFYLLVFETYSDFILGKRKPWSGILLYGVRFLCHSVALGRVKKDGNW